MKFLHTMVRVSDIDDSLSFFCDGLGLIEVNRKESQKGRFTLVFLASPDDLALSGLKGNEQPLPPGIPMVELTHNWDEAGYNEGRNFGHIAYQVANVYNTCQRLMDMGVTINRPPHDGYMAFVRSPDNVSIELLQAGHRLEPIAPWASMPNIGHW